MASPILALQQARQDPYAHVADLLPRALTIATKLGLDAFRAWIENELNGDSTLPILSLPRTPSVSSALKFRPARSMMTGMITLILTGLLCVLRTRRALVLENLALRHQLTVVQRTAPRPRLRTSDRLLWVLLSHRWRGWAEAVSIVQPETVIRWQRAGSRSSGLPIGLLAV